MGFGEAVKSGFNNCFDFSSRATRSEYWYFALFYALCDLAGKLLSNALSDPGPGGTGGIAFFPLLLMLLIMVVPHSAVAIRRLHDTNHSGWWYGGVMLSGMVATIGPIPWPIIGPALAIVCVVLWLVLIWLLASRGTAGANRFGPEKTPVPVSA